MKVKFVTCIYNNLYGTEYGGRPARSIHYSYSLLSILNISNATFVLYTSPEEVEEHTKFFYEENKISHTHLIIKSFDLKDSKYFNEIRNNKDLDKIKTIDRCYEIQFNKFYWLEKEIEDNFTHYYWIDAGLSHVGLFPSKFSTTNNSPQRYYSYSVFNNKLLQNLIDYTEESVFILGKDNTGGNFWSQTLPSKYYTEYNRSVHIIGGLFGGKKAQVQEYINLFDELLIKVLENGELYFEELLMSTLYFNYTDKFKMKYFQIWWHDESGLFPKDHTIYQENISFYKIFEDLQ